MRAVREERPSHFQVSLLQLLLVTLTVATIVWLNVDFKSSLNSGSEYGWPFGFYDKPPEVVDVPDVEVREPDSSGEEGWGAEAEVIRCRSWGNECNGGSAIPLLLLDVLFWAVFVVLAWVIGDPPSISRTTRDRLRHWKGRAGLRVRCAAGTRSPLPRPNGPCDGSQGQTEP